MSSREAIPDPRSNECRKSAGVLSSLGTSIPNLFVSGPSGKIRIAGTESAAANPGATRRITSRDQSRDVTSNRVRSGPGTAP